MMRAHYDVIVVGARPAGASTALLLARAGARVLVIERGRFGADTLSTHALMRGGVMLLNHWGARPAIVQAATPPIVSSLFVYESESVRIPVKTRNGVGALYAPRRTVLDSALATLAREAGADVVYGATLRGLVRRSDGAPGGVVVATEAGETRVTAGLVIGADGARSTVARLVGAEPYRIGAHASAVVYAHWLGLDVHEYRFSYGRNVSAGAIPTNHGVTCVFAAVPAEDFGRTFLPDRGAGYHRVIREADPWLGGVLAAGAAVSPWRGFPGQTGFLRQSWGPGWALVGDAGHFKDPLTAHGLTDAMRDAALLAGAVLQGGDRALASYQEARDELSIPIMDITDAIASFAWTQDRIQELHKSFSEAMSAEVRVVESLTEPLVAAGA